MSTADWEFPIEVRPKPEEVCFDLEAALSSVVALRAEIPGDAFTASILGTERDGNGVAIDDDGLVLTIGYLITEAQSAWLTTSRGTAVPGHVVAYDQVTGFGLVQALGRLGVPAMARGTGRTVAVGEQVIVASHGGRRHALKARVVARREFAGYWEYVLDEAIFTAPAHPHWGGAALIDRAGLLQGIGSLLIQEAGEGGGPLQGNMIVPIGLLEPIFDSLLRLGRIGGPPRPWLGMYTAEAHGALVVARLAPGGPAHRAQVKVGDHVVEVAGEPVRGLANLFRKIWALGPAGTDIPLTLAREGDVFRVQIRSADRNDFMKKPHLH
jgi:S1-C subfamily serine protease